MDAVEAIKGGLEMSEFVCMAYLGDLNDQELLVRPHPQCNHINWQIGHLIATEHQFINGVAGGTLPALPAGFAEKYDRSAAGSDDPQHFVNKDELMRVYREQRAATLAALAKCSAAELDEPTGIDFAPTKAAMYRLQGEHWLMHCGQWVIVRRLCSKPVVM